MPKYKAIFISVGATVLISFLIGCTGTLFKNWGSFKPSSIAAANFHRFVINDDYNYYITGSGSYPVAIFGLNKNYILDSNEDLWQAIDPSPKVIAKLVSNMQRKLMDCCKGVPHGFDILDNHGHKIGEWYSMLGLIVSIKIKEDGKVVIYPPSETDSVRQYQ